MGHDGWVALADGSKQWNPVQLADSLSWRSIESDHSVPGAATCAKSLFVVKPSEGEGGNDYSSCVDCDEPSELTVAQPRLSCDEGDASAVASWSLPATYSDLIATELTRLINEDRLRHGLPLIAGDEQLAGLAEAWSVEMARNGEPSHDDIALELAGSGRQWTMMSENVLRGRVVDGNDPATVAMDLHGAFMDSPAHRAAILDPEAELVGVAVRIGPDGEVWVVERFTNNPSPW